MSHAREEGREGLELGLDDASLKTCKSMIIEEFRHQGLGLGDAQNEYHSPPGTATVAV